MQSCQFSSKLNSYLPFQGRANATIKEVATIDVNTNTVIQIAWKNNKINTIKDYDRLLRLWLHTGCYMNNLYITTDYFLNQLLMTKDYYMYHLFMTTDNYIYHLFMAADYDMYHLSMTSDYNMYQLFMTYRLLH